MEESETSPGRGEKRERDWTKGSITRNLLLLSWPIAINQCLDWTGTIFDLIWVGKLGAAAVAGVGIAGIIIILANSALMGLTIGVRALIARFTGAGDNEGAVHVLRQALVIITGFYILLAVTGIPLAEPILNLFGAEADVVTEGATYLRIMFISSLVMSIWATAVLTWSIPWACS